MTRRSFGGTSADFRSDERGNVSSGGVGHVYRDQEKTLPVTDLLDADGSPISTVYAKTSPKGMVQFQGPDDGTATLWVEFGGGATKVVASDGFSKRGRLDDETISTARASAGSEAHASVFGSPADFSSTLGSGKLTLSGTALPSPTSGYTYTPEATGHYVVLVNSTGHNESLSSNSGRTAATAHRTMVWHTGQGDAVAYNAYVDVNGTPAGGSTHWLANAAGVILNGQVEIRQAHLYANPVEINISDNGFDSAGIGAVFNINRTVGAASLGEVWMGVRVQSIGSSAADVGFSLKGPFKRGLDLSQATLDASLAAISVAPTHRIYLNSGGTTLNGITWYAAQGTAWIESGGSSVNIQTANSIIKHNDTQVLTTRRTGYTAMTGTPDKVTAYATSTVTLAQLAGRVAQLQADLTTHGLIGA